MKRLLSSLSSSLLRSNYFEVFGQKMTYRIEISKLAVDMKTLQRNLHPDLFSLKSKEKKHEKTESAMVYELMNEEQELSEQLSSYVNKAYSVLQHPIERALYMLELKGIDSVTMEKKMSSDTQFLTEVMDLNERLEEINDKEQWAQFRQENSKQLASLETQLGNAFDSNEIDEAVVIVSKMKYFANLQEKLKELQTHLGVVD